MAYETNNATHVHIAGFTDAPVLDVYNAEIYNETSGNGSVISTAGLNRYTKWVFQVSGITTESTADGVYIQISLDGTNFDILRVSDVTASNVASTINFNRIYVPGFGSNVGNSTLSFNTIQVMRADATNSDPIVVRALGRV